MEGRTSVNHKLKLSCCFVFFPLLMRQHLCFITFLFQNFLSVPLGWPSLCMSCSYQGWDRGHKVKAIRFTPLQPSEQLFSSLPILSDAAICRSAENCFTDELWGGPRCFAVLGAAELTDEAGVPPTVWPLQFDGFLNRHVAALWLIVPLSRGALTRQARWSG